MGWTRSGRPLRDLIEEENFRGRTMKATGIASQNTKQSAPVFLIHESWPGSR